MIATEAGVSCPRCKRLGATPLAAEGDLQRYNCEGCGENFTAPANAEKPAEPASGLPTSSGFSHAPIAMADPDVSGIAGHCPKCKKPYLRLGKHYENHVASCDGTPYVEGASEEAIREALRKTNNNGVAAAELLGIPLRTFRRYTKKFGLSKVFVTTFEKAPAAPAPAPAPALVQAAAPVTAVPAGALKAFDLSIEALKAQRSALEAEIQGINSAIATIEKIKGLGGAPGAPFAAGA